MRGTRFELLTLEELLKTDSPRRLREVAEHYVRRWGPILRGEIYPRDQPGLVAEVMEQLARRNQRFPEGQIVLYDHQEDKPAGTICALRRGIENPREIRESYRQLTGAGYFDTHEREGNALCCVAVTADSATGHGLGKFLVQAELDLADRLGIKSRLALSRPEGLRRFWEAHKDDPAFLAGYDGDHAWLECYLDHLQLDQPFDGSRREYFDQALSTHAKNGARFVKYLPHARMDFEAMGYNVIMVYPPGTQVVDWEKLRELT